MPKRHLSVASSAAFALLAAVLLLPAARGEAESESSDRPKITGSYAVESGVRVLRLWGTPRERGFAHGYLLGDVLLRGIEKEFADLFRGRPGLYDKILRPLVRSRFTFSKSELAELNGILEGLRAKVPAAKRKVEAIGREPDLLDLKVLNTYGDWVGLGCSSAALWGGHSPDGKPVVVRNFDYTAMGLLVEHQHVRIVTPAPGSKEKGWVGICHPGSIGVLTVLNEEGVFAAIHDVPLTAMAFDLMAKNVPRLLAMKRLAAELPAKGAVEAAAEKCRSWPTLYGNNILVATPEPGEGLPAGVLEYDFRKAKEKGVTVRAAEVEGKERRSFVVCTNHHRRRGDGDGYRYLRLVSRCDLVEVGKDTRAAEYFALANRVAVPGPDEPLERGEFGTLHQVVAFTGTKTLHVRMVRTGGNIREAKSAVFDVVKVFAKTPAKK